MTKFILLVTLLFFILHSESAELDSNTTEILPKNENISLSINSKTDDNLEDDEKKKATILLQDNLLNSSLDNNEKIGINNETISKINVTSEASDKTNASDSVSTSSKAQNQNEYIDDNSEGKDLTNAIGFSIFIVCILIFLSIVCYKTPKCMKRNNQTNNSQQQDALIT